MTEKPCDLTGCGSSSEMYIRMLLRCQKIVARAIACCLALFALVSTASAIQVTRISWDPPNPAHNKFLLEFDQMPKYNVVDALEESNYFYIDFYGLEQNYKRNLLDIEKDPVLKYVDALSFPDNDVLRLVFYTRVNGAKFDIQPQASPPSITIYTIPPGGSLPGTGSDVAAVSTTPIPQADTAVQTNAAPTTPGVSTQIGFEAPEAPEPGQRISRQHSSGKKYIIIDPGHGGANGGAKSDIRIGGRILDEKDLTIKYAYELKKLIDSHPDLVGLLTRVDDTNVGLRERVKIAEENKGDAGNLFISLHLNDAPRNPNARGMEVFFLNQKGTVDAAVREIEEKENREVGLENNRGSKSLLTTVMTGLEQGRLLDWQYESYIFCKRLEQSFVSENYFARHNRGVKNANFVVLKNFEMPAVLLEIGFISNSTEVKNLVKPEFQELTAILVYNAINSYFAENDSSFQPRYIAPPKARFP